MITGGLAAHRARELRRCSRCVMDETAVDIQFDAAGHCNYCTEFFVKNSGVVLEDPAAKQRRLERLVAKIRREGKGRRYDCIIGVSGGVDSSWALMQAAKLGLRPLAVHMDNGWNSELAQNNIANLVRGLKVDLYTHVIDWDEYRRLMQAFFDADVVDVELLYDNAMLAVNFQQASAFGVKYILAGTNVATEGLAIPPTWNWFKLDRRNILAIGRRAGVRGLRTFPAIGVLGYAWHTAARREQWVSFLDFFPFEKERALQKLETEFGYKRYPYKHYESVFTRFYQGYILPRKFGIDKRLVHLSTLIVAGQLSREAALRDLERIAYPSERALEDDLRYFLKKMGWTPSQLNEYLMRPSRPHQEFGSERATMDMIRRLNALVPSGIRDLLRRKVS